MTEGDLAQSPEGLLRDFERREPGAMRLARCLSLASRIEPELLRWMRLKVLPDVGAAAEAALWFSPLVQVRSAAGLLLVPELAQELRTELARQESLLARAWSELQRFHRAAPRAVQLEERLLYLSLAPPSAEIDKEIQRLLAEVSQTLATPGREGVAAWALQALAQLPPRILASDAARRVSVQSNLIVSGRLALTPEPGAGLPEWLPGLLPRQLPHIPVYLRLDEQSLLVHGVELPGAVRLDVPATNPLLLDVEAGGTRHLLSFEPGETRTLPVTQESVELRTVTGKCYRLGRHIRERTGEQDDRLIQEQREELRAYLDRWAQSSWADADRNTMEQALHGLRRFGMRAVVGSAVAAVDAAWRLISHQEDGETPDLTQVIEESLRVARRVLSQRVWEAAPHSQSFVEELHRMEGQSRNLVLWLKVRCAEAAIEAAQAAALLFGEQWPKEEEAIERAAAAILAAIHAVSLLSELPDAPRVIHENLRAELLRDPLQVPATWSPSGLWMQVLGTARYELSTMEAWTADSLGRTLALHGHRLATDGSRGAAYVVARAYAAQLAFQGVHVEDHLIHILREGERADFPQGDTYSTRLPENVSQRLSAIMVMGEARIDLALLERERSGGVKLVPLAWTGDVAKGLLVRQREIHTTRQARFLDSSPRHQADVMQMVERAVLVAATPPGSKRSANETAFAHAMLELILAVVRPGPHTPAFGDYLRELYEAADDPSPVWKWNATTALGTLQAAMPQQAQWLAYDFVRLCLLQPGEPGVTQVVESLRPLVAAHALNPTLGALGRELGEIDPWAPREEVMFLVGEARALLGTPSALDRWLVARIGMTSAELEFRFMVAPTLELATNYLRPQSLDVSDRIALEIRERLQPALRGARPEFVHRMVTERRLAAIRVVAYLLFQLHPALATSKTVKDGLAAERAEAERLETRPLWQLLIALEKPLPHWRDDEFRDVAGALAGLLAFLEANPHVDGEGQCKARLRYLLARPFRSAYEEVQRLERYARRYEELRETQPSGVERTRVMNLLVFEIGTLVRRTRLVPEEVKARFALGRPGDRLVALAIVQARPEPECFDIVLEGILSSLTPFEQWTALNAANGLVPLLQRHQRLQLARALWEQRSGRPGASITRSDASRWDLSGELLEQIRQREPAVSAGEASWTQYQARLLEISSPELDDRAKVHSAANLVEQMILEAGRPLGATGPIPVVARRLVVHGQLSEEEHEAFQKLWSLRNEMVHPTGQKTVQKGDPRLQQMLEWVYTLVAALS